MSNLIEEFMNGGVFDGKKKQVFTEPIYKKRIKKENTVSIDEYNDIVREREYWRKDALYWEDRAKKWKKAYEKLNDKRNNTIEYLRQLKQNAPDEQALDKAISMLERKNSHQLYTMYELPEKFREEVNK